MREMWRNRSVAYREAAASDINGCGGEHMSLYRCTLFGVFPLLNSLFPLSDTFVKLQRFRTRHNSNTQSRHEVEALQPLQLLLLSHDFVASFCLCSFGSGYSVYRSSQS
ncbi:unnamed protein product [Pylaiella littoralis]